MANETQIVSYSEKTCEMAHPPLCWFPQLHSDDYLVSHAPDLATPGEMLVPVRLFPITEELVLQSRPALCAGLI